MPSSSRRIALKKQGSSNSVHSVPLPSTPENHVNRTTSAATPLYPPLSLSPTLPRSTSTTARHAPPRTFSGDLDKHVLQGLTTAGVATYCLSTLFGLFHVEVFLSAYQLPYTTYSFGRVIFSVLSTGSSLWSAWWLDSQVAANRLERSDLVGCLGVLLALSFILPFCRFWTWHDDVWYWHILDGLHFVVAMTCFDTLSTIMTISLASAVSDDHNMTDQERISNFSNTQVYILISSLLLTTVGLHLFDTNSMGPFQIFIVVLAAISVVVFGTAQSMVSGKYKDLTARNRKHKLWNIWKGWTVAVPRAIFAAVTIGSNHSPSHNNSSEDNTNGDHPNDNKTSKIYWRQAAHDLWNHTNFLRWVFLEMLFEMQTHFVQTFLKTFVDQLLVDVPHDISDWFLSLMRPMHQIMTIAIFVPIKSYGYPNIYKLALASFWVLSSLTLLMATPYSTSWILFFLVTYSVGSEAIRAAGFYLVMSDLVLELKQTHAQQGRINEPSLAGLLLGATTLFCKPLQSVLPIVAATLLDAYPQNPREVLYYLLVIPPWVCSLLQLWVWWDYDLHPKRTHELRVGLQEFHFYRKKKASSSSDNLMDYEQPTHQAGRRSHENEHAPKRRQHTSSSMDNSSGRLSAVI